MREIRFRGRSIDNNKWVYGWYFLDASGEIEAHYIKDDINLLDYEVFPQTVGQYTGLKDKNGVEIYEGDILGENPIGEVIFSKGEFLLAVGDKENYVEYNLNVIRRRNAIVGNVYENPELLEDK